MRLPTTGLRRCSFCGKSVQASWSQRLPTSSAALLSEDVLQQPARRHRSWRHHTQCQRAPAACLGGEDTLDDLPFSQQPQLGPAGIPLADLHTQCGHELWQVLEQQPAEFPAAVRLQLERLQQAGEGPLGDNELTSRLGADPGQFATAQQPAVPLRTPDSNSSSSSGFDLQDAGETLGREAQSVRHHGFRGLRDGLEDIMYLWAVAEAYVQDADMQNSMRDLLGRTTPGQRPLAQGPDEVDMLVPVTLLPHRLGQYKIGAVQFSKTADQRQVAGAGGAGNLEDGVQPAMEAVLASAQAKAMLQTEGSRPARMNREGAARTYHMYTMWGYFNRRMAERKRLERCLTEEEPASPGFAFNEIKRSTTPSAYGQSANTWRFFENVPDVITQLRCRETATVADRHLRALFGDEKESITTLWAWQHMLQEARWFGRALYDAEELIMRQSRDFLTEV